MARKILNEVFTAAYGQHIMAFSPEHPKWDRNPKFSLLSKKTGIPTTFTCNTSPGCSLQNRVEKKASRGQSHLKNDFIFSLRSRDTSKSFSFVSQCQNNQETAWYSHRAKHLKKRNGRRGSRSLDNAEFSHFTLLFCRGGHRNVPKLTHVHSHCSAHEPFLC